MSGFDFPGGFLWGSATAALQIEGAASSYGRGPSVWDTFCRDYPDRIYQGANPEVACDHYHRYLEDVEHMAALGHNAYRFSISWPRLLPKGRGDQKAQGLDFYDRLLDALVAKGIAPVATLYHWDLPQALESWESPETVDAFLEYAELCLARYGDRVTHWCTLNEPGWSTLNGYVTALHPPAVHDLKAAVLVSHHLMLAHRRVCRELRPRNGQMGIALNMSPVQPASSDPKDQNAARRADGVLNRWFSEAAVLGRYPEDIVELYDQLGYLPQGYDALPSGEIDFLGVNYYYPHYAIDAPLSNDFHLNNSGDKADACRFSLLAASLWSAILTASSPTGTGRSTPTGCATCCSTSLGGTPSFRFWSPKTASACPTPKSMERSRTRGVSSSSRPTFRRSPKLCRGAPTCVAT